MPKVAIDRHRQDDADAEREQGAKKQNRTTIGTHVGRAAAPGRGSSAVERSGDQASQVSITSLRGTPPACTTLPSTTTPGVAITP